MLQPYGAEMFPILVVDLLHEFELGVWKAVFTHLIRVLHAIPGDAGKAVIEFNARSVFSSFTTKESKSWSTASVWYRHSE
jgi:hypothetical protein